MIALFDQAVRLRTPFHHMKFGQYRAKESISSRMLNDVAAPLVSVSIVDPISHRVLFRLDFLIFPPSLLVTIVV